jgi:hypothetical protein
VGWLAKKPLAKERIPAAGKKVNYIWLFSQLWLPTIVIIARRVSDHIIMFFGIVQNTRRNLI